MADIALVALDGLVEAISLLEEAKAIRVNVLESAKRLRSRLHLMLAWLEETEKSDTADSSIMLQEQVKQVREMAYEIEDELEDFMIQVPPHFHSHRISHFAHDFAHLFTDYEAFSNFSDKMEKLNKIIDSLNFLSPHNGSSFNLHRGSGRRGDDTVHQALEDDEIVGYQDQKCSVISLLLAENPRIISVVGPGGAGKTIMMKNVIENREIKEKHSRQAWIDMSPPFMLNDVLLNIRIQLYGERNANNVPGTESVRDALIQYLKKEKYLVVLDNIRSIMDCDLVLNALPSGLRGSKIIVVTQDSNVGSSCVESEKHVIELQGLSEEDAWELFSRKAFGTGGTCPQDLTECAKRIIGKCEFMPFAVAAAGSFLSKAQKISVVWERFYNSFETDIRTNSKLWIINHILSRSFKDLPSHLKTCLL